MEYRTYRKGKKPGEFILVRPGEIKHLNDKSRGDCVLQYCARVFARLLSSPFYILFGYNETFKERDNG